MPAPSRAPSRLAVRIKRRSVASPCPALLEIRRDAAKLGLDDLSSEEIEREIAAVRKVRRQRQP